MHDIMRYFLFICLISGNQKKVAHSVKSLIGINIQYSLHGDDLLPVGSARMIINSTLQTTGID